MTLQAPPLLTSSVDELVSLRPSELRQHDAGDPAIVEALIEEARRRTRRRRRRYGACALLAAAAVALVGFELSGGGSTGSALDSAAPARPAALPAVHALRGNGALTIMVGGNGEDIRAFSRSLRTATSGASSRASAPVTSWRAPTGRRTGSGLRSPLRRSRWGAPTTGFTSSTSRPATTSGFRCSASCSGSTGRRTETASPMSRRTETLTSGGSTSNRRIGRGRNCFAPAAPGWIRHRPGHRTGSESPSPLRRHRMQSTSRFT